tara:strand:+ start:361 stop:1206 length:846 start_codon:yes stop_codon:yes gene_type:complete
LNIKTNTAALVRKAKSNFYYAFLFLPKQKREAIYAAYAFSRHTDDLVDEAESPEKAAENLEGWRAELQACYCGAPTHPIAISLQNTLKDFSIPMSHFSHLIDGVEMDLTKRRYDSFDDLYDYCYRVASVIGLICIDIFGYKNIQTREYAVNLGLALQLTNIIRDVATDARKGRIYLPNEDLVRFGYTEAELLAESYNGAFVDLMTFQYKRAREYYINAWGLLPIEDRKTLFSAEIMGNIYYLLLQEAERARFNVFSKPIRIGNFRKFGIAATIWARSLLLR